MENKRNNSLKKLALHSTSNEIKRPPNAFMLYASDTRKHIAEEHPNLNNKEISCILGNRWANEPKKIREEYHNKARQIALLHKQRYPDYMYSPRVARQKKMEKQKLKMERAKIIKEDRKTQGMVRINENKSYENRHEEDYHLDCCIPPCKNPEFSSHFPRTLQHLHAASLPSCSSTGHSSSSVCSFCCASPTYYSQVPQIHRTLYQRYRGSRTMNPSACYNQERCNSPEDSDLFSYPIQRYCSCGCNKPSFENFHNLHMPYHRNSMDGLHHNSNSNIQHSQESENEVPVKCTESDAYFSPTCGKEHLPVSRENNYSYEKREINPEDRKSFTNATRCCSSKCSSPCFGYFDAGFHSQHNTNVKTATVSENEVALQNPKSDVHFSQACEKECLQVSGGKKSSWESEGNSPEDKELLAYATSCCSSKRNKLCLGYFDNSHVFYHSRSTSGFPPRLTEKANSLQASENEIPNQNSESDAYFSQSCEKECAPVSRENNSRYEERGNSPEDRESFANATPCNSSKCSRPCFGYFDNSHMLHHSNSTAGFHSQLQENMKTSQISENEAPGQSFESDAYSSQSCEKERLLVSSQRQSRYEEQGKNPKDMESFAFLTPCFSSACNRPPFEYFHNPRMTYHRNFIAGFNPQQEHTNMKTFQASESEVSVQNPKSDTFFSQQCEKQPLLVSRQNNSSCEVQSCTQNRISSESQPQESQCLPNFIKPDANDNDNDEKSSCSSDLSIDSRKCASEVDENENSKRE